MRWLVTTWWTLTSPHPSVADPALARRLRLLAGLTLGVLLFGVPCSLGIFVFAREHFIGDPTLSALCYGLVGVLYQGLRSRMALPVTWTMVLGLVPVTWGLLSTAEGVLSLAVVLPLGLVPLTLAALIPDPRALRIAAVATLPCALLAAWRVAGPGIAPLLTAIAVLVLVVLGLIALQELARADHRGVLEALTQARAARRAERTAELAAREALAVRERFLLVVHHELKTPLHGLIGAAELLAGEPDGPDARALGAAILQSAQRLHQIVADVLVLVEDGEAPALVAVDVAALCDSLTSQVARERAGVAVNVYPRSGVVAMVDAGRCAHVVRHLVRNAVAFTETGRIEVRTSIDGPWLTVQVQDTGCGMTNAELEQAFEPLCQLRDGLTRPHEGMGLGLAASRTLARSLGGEVSGVSRPGEGSLFTLKLPVAA